jgi:hypothetical protein
MYSVRREGLPLGKARNQLGWGPAAVAKETTDCPTARCTHERERVRREKERMEREGREVTSQFKFPRVTSTGLVWLSHSICCGATGRHASKRGWAVSHAGCCGATKSAKRVGVIRAYVAPRHESDTRHPPGMRQCTRHGSTPTGLMRLKRTDLEKSFDRIYLSKFN